MNVFPPPCITRPAGQPEHTQISVSTLALLRQYAEWAGHTVPELDAEWRPTGGVLAKGKGMMQSWVHGPVSHAEEEVGV